MKNRLDISDSTAVSMPMKNLLAIIAAVAVGVWAYFGVIERLNKLETNTTLLTKDLEQAEEALSLDIEKNNESPKKGRGKRWKNGVWQSKTIAEYLQKF